MTEADDCKTKANFAGYSSSHDPFFMHLNGLLHLGSTRPLEEEDLGLLSELDTVEASSAAFTEAWNKELLLPVEQRSFRRAIFGKKL